MKTIMLPKGSSDPLPESAAYLEPFAPLFQRSTSRRSLERYVTGLLSDLPRKNCEAIAQALAVLVTVKATGAAGPGRKAGCSGSAHCRGRKGIPSGFGVDLPAETPLSRLVELAHLRWPIEQFYEDAKGECGLDHFQGRSWDGLHRHLALVMLAYTLLMLQSLGQQVRTDPVPAGAAFLPCSTTQPSGLPSPGARPALPGCGLMAH